MSVLAIALFTWLWSADDPFSTRQRSRTLSSREASDRRLLQESPSPTCAATAAGLPVYGVHYVPHLVGEPYPKPDSKPLEYYGSAYHQFHRRDLPLIGNGLAATALSLRPWPVEKGGRSDLGDFFSEMSRSGVCKLIPSFHLAKYYADMLKQGKSQPNTDTSSAFSKDFVRFGGSVSPEHVQGVEVVAWSVDLSPDLEALLPLVTTSCDEEPKDESYTKYKLLLEALHRWVDQRGPAGPAAPALTQVPLLVPLDLSRVPWSLPQVENKLRMFMHCMATSWTGIFDERPTNASARWLLAFSVPWSNDSDGGLAAYFEGLLESILGALDADNQRAVVMLGAQALRPDPANANALVADYGSEQQPARQQLILKAAFESYKEKAASYGKLDGFILDEWMDDWDRGSRGPFFLAAETLRQMEDLCPDGGRFSHDADRCARKIGSKWVHPEFFGQASSASRTLQHCVGPRFPAIPFAFGGNSSTGAGQMWQRPLECSFLLPSFTWIYCALAFLAAVALAQAGGALCGLCREDEQEEPPTPVGGLAEPAPAEPSIGHVTVTPQEPSLQGGHVIELRSLRLRSNAEAGWWLWAHLSAQMSILERQIASEVLARRALRERARFRGESRAEEGSAGAEDPDLARTPVLRMSASSLAITEGGDDLSKAVATIHRRCLEGFAAWCDYVSNTRCPPPGIDRLKIRGLAQGVGENSRRPSPRLFAEALLLRTMESLGEQLLQCPERLSWLLHRLLLEASCYDDGEPATFSIDLEELQDGLDQMQEHSNPYKSKRMRNGKWSRGINFDDINECGIQCREDVVKTYKEPTSVVVIVDFFLSYRVPLVIKLWTLALAGYIYLGSGNGNDITTNYNGTLLKPKWLRVNFIQYVSLIDASLWSCTEVMLVLYVLWQRWPSLCKRSPGVPTIKWLLKHLFNIAFSVIGGWWVYNHRNFKRKPWQCRQSDMGECVDDRSETYGALLSTLWCPLIYWASRLVIFVLMNKKSVPIFIHGTPWKETRRDAGRGLFANCSMDLKVNLMWVAMLASCVVFEVFFLLPSMRGLDWNTTCGLDALGPTLGIPQHVGTCTHEHLTYSCITCVSSINLAGLLIFLGAMVDIYFVFYVFSAVFGTAMGHSRHLNDLKNTSLPIDLRPQVGRDARRFEVTFGPGWQQVWKLMVEGLVEESLIGAHHAHGLCEAAGIALDGDELRTRREKKEQPIHLARFPTLAAERLAFFFRSLEWIERGARGTLFQSETDALTGERFDVGSVPSLTQIIPAYNEVVIPSEDFLRAGSETADAMNQSPMGRRGVGDLTDPPRGDGVNTNLAFMISQFPDEWDFFAEQLCEQGRTDDPSGQSLYANFAKEKLRDELVVEVRFWACLRMQSVAKTVIGALQYERALASLPKIKDYYRAHPQKRVPEDHAELILAHQTYGMPAPKGNPENDESVRLLLSRFSKDPVYLVFDLTPESSREVWQLVETFLHRRSFYEPQAFRHASVKCRWDTSVRDLRVVDVLPRRFPLLLGQGNFRTQGKASNQLNGLRFAMGHNVQAMDCNMGVFIGEGFKVPYVLRLFMPLDKMDRVATRARYLGFREYIFTGREGTVGKCHAAAEWTFGTVYQRFLSGIGTRMHYGHPDFVDCFWARNRGGMSKSSPVVNLSEDIFAGYNVRSREEVLPHVDALEFEKGREATFNAASNFFSKISGGSVAVLRSRDNHLICEHIGILHSLSFYFTSVAFYVSNLLIDISIYLYVALFIVFTLANIDLGRLSALGSTFRTEWVLSMGIVSLFPQLFEMVLEFGSIHAIRDVVGGFCASTFFFIFQNKNIASAMKNGAATGIAKYLFTGRPMANQHQTWKDCYVTYWKSHYRPAISLLTAYLIYSVLVVQTFQGKLPMILVVISYIAWIITPIVFSPFPRLSLLEQDLREFNSFINGRAGMDPADLPEVIERGKTGRVRTLYECGLADEISVWCEQPLPVLLLYVVLRLAVCGFLALSLPSVILDFLWVFFIVLSLQWMLILGFVLTGLSNIFFLVSILLWLIVLPFGYWVHGDRAVGLVRVPEYVVSLAVFLFLLGLAKQLLLLACRAVCELRQRPCGWPQGRALRRLQRSVRMSHVFFFVHQQNVLLGYLVLVANLATSLFLVLLDLCNLHTWWLLNGEAAKAQRWQAKLQGPGPAEHEARSHGSSSPCSSGGEAPPPRGRAGSMV